MIETEIRHCFQPVEVVVRPGRDGTPETDVEFPVWVCENAADDNSGETEMLHLM